MALEIKRWNVYHTMKNAKIFFQVHEIVAKRARPESSNSERENWIKTKYIAKAFVKGAALMMPSIHSGNTGCIKRLLSLK